MTTNDPLYLHGLLAATTYEDDDPEQLASSEAPTSDAAWSVVDDHPEWYTQDRDDLEVTCQDSE